MFSIFVEVDHWRRHEENHHQCRVGTAVWRRNSSSMRQKLGLPRATNEWSARKSAGLASLRGVCDSERQRDLLDVAWASRRQSFSAATPLATLKVGFWVDVSGSVARKPWGDSMPGMSSTSQIYSFECDRCLSGTDMIKAFAWPAGYLAGASQAELMAVASGASPLPMVCILQLLHWAQPFAPWNCGSVDVDARR